MGQDLKHDGKGADASDIRIQLRIQKTVSRVSSRFVGNVDFDNAVNASLRDIGRLCGAARAYLFVFSNSGATMHNTHEWCAPGVEPQIDRLQNLPTKVFPWWMRKLRKGEIIHIRNVKALPRTASAEKEILESQDIKSLLVLPVSARNRLQGFIGFDNVAKTGSWRRRDIELLRVSAGILGSALERRRIDKLLRARQARLAASRRELKTVALRVLAAREEEARRIAADLHDEAGGFAVIMGSELSGLEQDIIRKKWADARRSGEKCRQQLMRFTARLKRIAVELRPPALQAAGIDGALREYFADIEKRAKPRIHFEFDGKAGILEEHAAIAIFRVIQEALVNAAKHAEARNVRVRLSVSRAGVSGSVYDDGRGFDTARLRGGHSRGAGLLIMRERI